MRLIARCAAWVMMVVSALGCHLHIAMAAELVGLDHIAINVRDVQKSADWYERVLGFKVLHKWDNAWMIGRGNIKLGLFIAPNAIALPDLNSHLVIRKVAFLVDGDKFSDAINDLKNKGVDVSVTEDTGIAWGIGSAWVYTRSGGAWTQQGSKLVGTGAVGNAGQGYHSPWRRRSTCRPPA
jgi:catechol 2,3-dioxygenase-like lactoylglutathione lyase family enzyme